MIWTMVACILLTIAVITWAMNISKKNEELESKLEQKELIMIAKNAHIIQLQQELRHLRQNYNQRSMSDQSEEIKVAIKYAMIKSHPDNGGSQDDFIKFRKLYQDVSR